MLSPKIILPCTGHWLRPEMTNKPLSILMAVPQYPYPIVGGLEKQAHELANALIANGHRVCAISGKISPDQPATSTIDGVEVFRLRWPKNRHVRWFASAFGLWRRARPLVEQADVVHVHVFSSFFFLFVILAAVCGKPVLVKLPGIDRIPALASGWLGWLRVWLFKRADAAVAMAPESIAELKAIAFPEERIFATSNGIDIAEIPLADADNGKPPFRFAYTGRLEAGKGLSDLLAAAKHLADAPSTPAFRVDLFGDGPLRADIAAWIDREGIGAIVALRGWVDNVPKLLAASHALVLPSYGEGNSNSILEAMAVGLPIVSTRVGGTPMLVGPEGAELLCAPGDVAALGANMARLLASPDYAARQGAAMRHRVEEHFDIRRVAERYVKVYQLLAAGQRDLVYSASNSIVTGAP